MADFDTRADVSEAVIRLDEESLQAFARRVGQEIAEPEVAHITSQVQNDVSALIKGVVLVPQKHRPAALRALHDVILRWLDEHQVGVAPDEFSGPQPHIPSGSELGRPLSRADADARRKQMALPMSLESWAGICVGPSELAARFEISRTTLNNWRRDGLVIAFPRGRRAHVYPVSQFADNAPLDGIREVLDFADGDPKVAWRWLLTPHHAFAHRAPLEALKDGNREAVVRAAEYSLG
ncbi:hypothetical protein X907_2232 [Glycocaulis alkaliphilus]|uniref:Antitoxin Xre/MbcA/ParS-like middle domain-containing protein n=1 Tax=Glycocaulis alkaliphilus TaxID=1434191 RepID=A0A3T0EBX9_9PROT|nr:hypothetical protein [Glycocaulis alkaliphilus]AZU04747.1 hypothetical protein X907_2232 [Glycocaulis alkaliphilus]GGB67984.1 hypothetical protein GCM10007417_04790 [Glycocaulis alkaliphilus]